MNDNQFSIFKYGEEVLKLRAHEIKNINEDIENLVAAMKNTLIQTPGGIGLAAPQVGKSVQLAIIDPSFRESENDYMVVINPRIIEVEGGEIENEGCLSIPGFSLPVERKTRILVSICDLNGKETRQEFEGFMARVIQHEIDHLRGLLILDRVSPLKRQLVRREIKKLKRNGEW